MYKIPFAAIPNMSIEASLIPYVGTEVPGPTNKIVLVGGLNEYAMIFSEEIKDQEGDTLYWTYRAVDPAFTRKLTVFND